MSAVLKVRVHKAIIYTKEEIAFIVRPTLSPGQGTQPECGD
jgi:hypothetical protein